MYTLTEVKPPGAAALLEDLTELLIDSVRGGASVGFLADIGADEAEAYWRSVLDAAQHAHRVLLAAHNADGKVVGTAQLDLCTKPNGRHRAEVQKVLVHSGERGNGLGKRLLARLEALARERGLRLLVLDTVPGSVAEKMYAKEGYERAGEIPDYATFPDGRLSPTVLFYKRL